METTTTFRTYAEAAKIAEPVNTDELRDLIAQDDGGDGSNPDIYRRKHTQRRIAWRLSVSRNAGYPYVSYKYCDGEGYTRMDVVTPSEWLPMAPIFHFERLGRIVRWEVK